VDSFRLAKVVAAHPEGYSVDLVFLDDGSRVPSVQVSSPSATTNSGLNDLPVPTASSTGADYDVAETKDRDVYALVTFVRGVPVVMGFLFPQICQMLFADLNRRIDRHASDVYTSIDAQGNYELYHPSGTYLRIGASAAHEDLTGKDFDKKWKITKNKTAPVHVHLSVANNGSEVASLDFAPTGDAVLHATSVLISSPATTISGTLHVEGHITYDSGISGTGDIVADGISSEHHHHPDPQGGQVGEPS
jgi:hypothetical protein